MLNIPRIQKYLTEIDQEMKAITGNTEINAMVENFIKEITGAESASIWIYEDSLLLKRERSGESNNEIHLNNGRGLLYKCFATKEAGIYNYIASEKGYVASIDNPDNIKIKSKIMVPLVDNDKLLGIATAYSSIKQIKNFTQDDLNIFKAITPSLINAILKMLSNKIDSSPLYDRREAGRENKAGFKRRKTDIDRRQTDSINNLNEIEKSREETQKPNELLDYISNIVHDIRTPTNSLYGFLEILEEKIDDKRLKEYVLHAKDSAKLVSELTTSILDGVSSKRITTTSKQENVAAFKFFADIAEIFSANMYEKHILYNIYIDPKLPKGIIIDSMKLKRIILNLIGNAYKFTKENESIEFFVQYLAKESKVYIHVKDSGIGIAKEKQEQIFKRSKQAEDDTKDKYGGTGLGLAISAGYVKDLGGKLSLESQLEKGSRFYFDIPIEISDTSMKFQKINNPAINITMLINSNNSFVGNFIAKYLVELGISIEQIDAADNIDDISEKTTHLIVFENKLSKEIHSFVEMKNINMLIVEENFLSLDANDTKGVPLISQYSYYTDTLYTFVNVKRIPKVLIVDDDKISVSLIKNMLLDELCDITVTFNSVGGLELLIEAQDSEIPYDMVFLDNKMPILTGEELLHRYRGIERAKNKKPIKAISISGDPYNDDLKEFDIFVGKPFNKKLIVSVFNDVVQSL